MLAIIDYGAGNLTSVARALNWLGVPNKLARAPAELEACQGVIFPGVGAAGEAMANLRRSGLDKALKGAAARGVPVLGVCLGCQIMLEKSEEGNVETLGIFPGSSARFPDDMREADGSRVKIPHMGWNTLKRSRPAALLAGVAEDAQFYFVHSYYVKPDPSLVLATTEHGLEFCALYGREGLWCAQFHPEKSGAPGLKFLKNFYDYCREA